MGISQLPRSILMLAAPQKSSAASTPADGLQTVSGDQVRNGREFPNVSKAFLANAHLDRYANY